MSTLTDYIEWYADLSFYEKPFNEVDNLVLSTLIYYDFNWKPGEKPKSLRRCVTNSTANDSFLRSACRSVRFGSLVVSDYQEIFDPASHTQFAAVRFHLYDNYDYIAFRGTDNSLVGWREDFMMSYRKTASQTRAVEYLERVIASDCDYYVGGHSKGGNLALYGCCHLSDEQLARVKHIYNNDGPGLCPEVSDVTLVDRVKARTTLILPQYCIFGKLFAQEIPDTRIVTSSGKGINQHDLVSWGVSRGKLETVKDFDGDSLWMNEVADRLIRSVNTDDRERLVESIFSTFEQRGAKTRDEMFSGGIDDVEDLVKNMVESDSLKTAAEIPKMALFGDFLERLRTGKLSKLINANQLVEGIVLSVVGILMLIFPTRSFNTIIVILLGGIVTFQLIYTVRKLYQSRWNFARERARVYIFVAMATLFALILVKKQAVFIVGSGIAGGWLLVTAYRSFLSAKASKVRDFAFCKNAVKAVLYLLAGVFIMVAPIETLKWFVLALGTLMAVDGVCTIVYSFIQANDKYSEKYSQLKDKVTHKNKE